MTPKTQKLLCRILKIIWITIGVFILLVDGLLYMRMQSINNLGVIALAMFFAAGVYIFFIYLGITLLFLFIRWIIKRKRR